MQGGIIDKDMPSHVSNVTIFCDECDKPTRIGYRFDDDGNKVQVCRKSGRTCDGATADAGATAPREKCVASSAPQLAVESSAWEPHPGATAREDRPEHGCGSATQQESLLDGAVTGPRRSSPARSRS